MKLLRVKLTDSKSFRSIHAGFEYQFRNQRQIKDELNQYCDLAPFVCAGRNGSGKSNLLELLAAIFFQLEVLRVRRSFLPDAFFYDQEANSNGIPDGYGIPDAFELEYLITKPSDVSDFLLDLSTQHIRVTKLPGRSPVIETVTTDFNGEVSLELATHENLHFFLPSFVLGYSSGENEILSLPFFKMRFIQFDEYWNALKKQQPYPGRPDTRLAYLDSGFSQAILICNLLYNDEATLAAFRKSVGIEELKEFRIILKRSIPISEEQIVEFGEPGQSIEEIIKARAPLFFDLADNPYRPKYHVNLLQLLEANERSATNSNPIITRLNRCATCHYTDPETDTLYLDYFVNEATRQAFRDNFDFAVNGSPIALFQAFQVLLSLNLYTVSNELKAELYKSDSHYVSETIPTLASDERIMRFKFVKFTKSNIEEPIMLKALSDGEHQLLHSLGLCLLFKNTNSLFLLDEPETHFNPDWRSNFISQLRACFADVPDTHEMLITTHSPFLISDTTPDRVLEFEKVDGQVRITHPEYNTFGASINTITMSTFDKRETIGGRAQAVLEELRSRFVRGDDKQGIINELNRQLGDSVEKVLLIKTILDSMEKPR
ncbi:MAG: restriction system-associated AAA family ATPase [Pirellulales bacterium]